ncbi:MAG: GMP/IMP nucleotidase [Thiotrichaceae bacterium]
MNSISLNWQQIHSVFLDMDGTLLDLHFDNHFWREHLPAAYAQQQQLSLTEAKSHLYQKFIATQGTLSWYCVDYWTQQLNLDIAALKAEVAHLIALHPHTIEFLTELRRCHKRVVLVTNAHRKSINLKMQHIPLTAYFDQIVSSHDIGLPKETPEFWQHLQKIEPYNQAHTLFIDDNLPVLRVAQADGIAHLLAISQPDSRAERKDIEEFNAINHFGEIMPCCGFI